jgi:hypothetical protein
MPEQDCGASFFVVALIVVDAFLQLWPVRLRLRLTHILNFNSCLFKHETIYFGIRCDF